MRKFLLVIIVLLAVLFLVTRFSEVQAVVQTLRTGDWRYVLLAILCEILWLWGLGKTYQSIYRILGIHEDHVHMLSLAAGAFFINVVAPIGGMSAMAVFLSDARKRGHPVARVTMAGVIYLLCEYLAILIAFALAFFVLVRRNNLHWPEVTAAGVILLGVIVLLSLLALSSRSPRLFMKVLAWITRAVNQVTRPLIRREYLSLEQVNAFAIETSDCLTLIRQSSRRQLAQPMFYALSNKVLLIGIMALVFMAFSIPISAGTVVAAFGLGYLFAVVSPTPSGVGLVEGILTLSLRSLGIPLEPAAVITLAFRGVTFWEPLFIGGYMFRRANAGKKLILGK